MLATDGELSTYDDYIPSHNAPHPHKQTMLATPMSHILSVAPQCSEISGAHFGLPNRDYKSEVC